MGFLPGILSFSQAPAFLFEAASSITIARRPRPTIDENAPFLEHIAIDHDSVTSADISASISIPKQIPRSLSSANALHSWRHFYLKSLG